MDYGPAATAGGAARSRRAGADLSLKAFRVGTISAWALSVTAAIAEVLGYVRNDTAAVVFACIMVVIGIGFVVMYHHLVRVVRARLEACDEARPANL
jgi:hypothetical protein